MYERPQISDFNLLFWGRFLDISFYLKNAFTDIIQMLERSVLFKPFCRKHCCYT